MATPDIASEIPAGFGPMPHMDGFIAHPGPFHARADTHHNWTYRAGCRFAPALQWPCLARGELRAGDTVVMTAIALFRVFEPR